MSWVSFYTPLQNEKTKDILIFSGGIKRDQWHEMVVKVIVKIALKLFFKTLLIA